MSISYILTLCILSEILTKSLSYRGNLAGKMGSNPKVIGSSFELVGFYCGGKKLSFSLITPIKIVLKKLSLQFINWMIPALEESLPSSVLNL